MSFSYENNPSANIIDYVRFNLGDKNATKPYLTDEEILSVSSNHINKRKILIECCEAILATLADRVTYAVGPEKVNLTDAYNNYCNVLARIKTSKKHGTPPFYVSTPQFNIGMHDNV